MDKLVFFLLVMISLCSLIEARFSYESSRSGLLKAQEYEFMIHVQEVDE